MAKNTGNNRIPVKWVRDKAKSAYDKKNNCYICDTVEDLELHHTNSITLLLEEWSNSNNYDISTDEGILAVRDEFIETYHKEIYEDVYTLCSKHHIKLHSIYGKKPPKHTANKQVTWIDKQREKFLDPNTGVSKPKILGSLFSQFT
jgi:5-methylcytosine-specific restriction endonuclease McrA